MTDIFNEIDEDLRRERLGKLWKRFGPLIIALAVLIVVGVAAWRGYEWWQVRTAQADGARFAAAMQLAEEGKHAEAAAAFAEIGRDGSAGYRVLGRFRAAAELAFTDKAAAVSAYDALANENGVDPLARDVARIRAGMLLVDTAPLADIEARMKPLDTPTGAFRLSAREVLGLAQYRAGDYETATKTFEGILSDPQLPPGMRQRAELMRSLAAAGAPAPATTVAPSAPVTPELPTLPGAAGVPDASPMPSGPIVPGAPALPDVAVPVPPGPAEPPAAIPALPEPAANAPATAPEPAPAETQPAAPAPEAPAPDAPADAAPAAPAPEAPAPEAPAAAPPAPEAPAAPAPEAPASDANPPASSPAAPQ